MKNVLRVNDEVEFTFLNRKYTGFINLILPNGLLRINSLIGEFRRKPEEVVKIQQ